MGELIVHYAEWIVAVSAGVGVLLLALRKVKRQAKGFFARLNMASETLLGREEIRHPETGNVLAEATPNLGTRFARMEDALVKMSDTSDGLKSLTKRVDIISTSLGNHLHDSALRDTARSEEQKSMWEAITALANRPQPVMPTEVNATVTTTTTD